MNLQSALKNPIFKIISASADELGMDSYVVGGFVRDHMLQRNTGQDIDIVAVGDGVALAKKVADNLPNKPKVSVFKNYGTAMLRYEDIELEFVGARKDQVTFEVMGGTLNGLTMNVSGAPVFEENQEGLFFLEQKQLQLQQVHCQQQ